MRFPLLHYCIILFIVNSFIFNLACRQKSDLETIPKSTLVKILADIHIMQAAYAETHDTRKDSISSEFEDQLEMIYGYPAETIRQNIALLQTQNERYDSLYEAMIDYIDTLQKNTPLKDPNDTSTIVKLKR